MTTVSCNNVEAVLIVILILILAATKQKCNAYSLEFTASDSTWPFTRHQQLTIVD